jgi:hypothetical protein
VVVTGGGADRAEPEQVPLPPWQRCREDGVDDYTIAPIAAGVEDRRGEVQDGRRLAAASTPSTAAAARREPRARAAMTARVECQRAARVESLRALAVMGIVATHALYWAPTRGDPLARVAPACSYSRAMPRTPASRPFHFVEIQPAGVLPESEMTRIAPLAPQGRRRRGSRQAALHAWLGERTKAKKDRARPGPLPVLVGARIQMHHAGWWLPPIPAFVQADLADALLAAGYRDEGGRLVEVALPEADLQWMPGDGQAAIAEGTA